MRNGPRFWLMVSILAAGTIALHLLSHGDAIPLEKPLTSLPMNLGPWQGFDAPLPARIIKAAAVDDYVSRGYQIPGAVPILLYVGYYRSQRTGQWVHSPKNCLPGAGWEPINSKRILLTLPNGKQYPINLYIIENGLHRQLVLYWYQAHGRIVASEYWGKIYMVLDALEENRTDTALVRISTPLEGSDSNALPRVRSFAEGLLPELLDLLPK